MVTKYAVNLTQDDLQANDQGKQSKAQISALQQRRLLYLAGTLAFAGIFAALVILLFLKLRFPSFASRGELFFWGPLGLFWMYLLHFSPVRLFRTHFDLREGKIARVDGRVNCRWRNTFGVIQFPRYEVRVADEVFPLSSNAYFQFVNHGNYQIIYAPRAKVFLGAVPIIENQGDGAEKIFKAGPQEDISSLLNQRELEILKLLANGLSNKEIASQLSLSINTIKMYTSQIYQKLGVRRRTEAIAWARNRGLL